MEKKQRRIAWGLGAIVIIVGIVFFFYFQSHTAQNAAGGFVMPWNTSEHKEDELPKDDAPLPTVYLDQQKATSENSDTVVDENQPENSTQEENPENTEVPENPTDSGNGLHPNELPLDVIQ